MDITITRVHYHKFHRVICHRLDLAEFGIQRNRLVINHHQAIVRSLEDMFQLEHY